MTLTVGSLFSGIGGLDLGLERAGMKVIWQSEIDPYACQVLKKHWKDVPNHGNIKEIDWDNIERPDVVCGGYPCQPFSNAGRRKGEEDPRHLFPWVLTAISRLRPRYAVLENVRGHLSLGGTTVLASLACIGYDAEWRVVSAASVGAPHRRDRVIIVAYPTQQLSDEPISNGVVEASRAQGLQVTPRGVCGKVSYSDSVRCLDEQPEVFSAETRQQALCELAIGSWWSAEPDVGRVANGIPRRVDRLRGLGNAVVPQVAEVIGRMVVAHSEQ